MGNKRFRGPAAADGGMPVPHLLPARQGPHHSLKAFRRLSNKTLVFFSPEGDHYRARLTHTLEVGRSRGRSRALRLNEDLTEAIALGHDSGIRRSGQPAEAALDEVCRSGSA